MSETAKKQVRLALISGYLGAGKTTLLNRMLSNVEGMRIAVIVNDIGEVNIDAELIAKTGTLADQSDDLIPMTNGCICCSLSEDLENQIREIATSGDYDYIVIEASGVCEPMPIAYTLAQVCEPDENGFSPLVIDNIISVVDCARMFDEFNGGQALVDEDVEEDDLACLIIQQIEFCTTLVLNKVDTVTPEQLAELRAIVRGLQQKAKIIEAVRGEIPLAELLNTGLYDFDTAFDSATWVDAMENPEKYDGEGEHAHDHDHHAHDHDHDREHGEHAHEHHHHDHGPDCACGCHDHDHDHGDHDHLAEYGITTFVYERRRPLSMEALQALAKDWPASIIRCKGMVWLTDDEDTCYIFEQAGSQFYVDANGNWLATADPEEQEQIKKSNPRVLDGWDDEIGDRRVKLVFIGKGMDRAAIEAQVDALLS